MVFACCARLIKCACDFKKLSNSVTTIHEPDMLMVIFDWHNTHYQVLLLPRLMLSPSITPRSFVFLWFNYQFTLLMPITAVPFRAIYDHTLVATACPLHHERCEISADSVEPEVISVENSQKLECRCRIDELFSAGVGLSKAGLKLCVRCGDDDVDCVVVEGWCSVLLPSFVVYL